MGGIVTNHVKQEISRAPFFILDNIREADDFIAWIDAHFDVVKKGS